MRLKTVPRRLPRKATNNIDHAIIISANDSRVIGQNYWREKGLVTTVNFSTVGDIVQQVDLSKQDLRTKSATLQQKRSSEAALDLSWQSDKSARVMSDEADKFKDTYLYQLMTNPRELQQAIDRQASTQQQQQQQQPQPQPQQQQQQQQQQRCPYCKKEFVSESELKSHLSLLEQVSSDSTEPSRRRAQQLSCCACGKSFAQKRYLRYHQRSHSERSKYSCDICTRKYSRLDNLTRHNIFHTNPDKFPCNSCERTFARKDLLNKHLRCHENKYKYHCDICQKYFKGPLSLDNHRKLFHLSSSSSSSSSSSPSSPPDNLNRSNK